MASKSTYSIVFTGPCGRLAFFLLLLSSPPYLPLLVFLREGQDHNKLPKLVYNFLGSSDRLELVVSPLSQFPE